MKIRLKEDQDIWFISDTHFGHANILKFDNRPFGSIKEHDAILIENWNGAIAPDDIVFFLGDFAFGSSEFVKRIYNRLSGQITFIKGNHEKPLCQYLRSIGKSWYDYLEIKVYDEDLERQWQDICLFHYPIAEWNKGHYGAWLLYGHTHGNSWYDKEFQPKHKCLNVGAPCIHYSPVSYKELKRKMAKKAAIEHH